MTDDPKPADDQTTPDGFSLGGEQSREENAAQGGVYERPGDLVADADAIPDDEADDEDGTAPDDDELDPDDDPDEPVGPDV